MARCALTLTRQRKRKSPTQTARSRRVEWTAAVVLCYSFYSTPLNLRPPPPGCFCYFILTKIFRPIPDLAVGSLPKQVLSFAPDGTARAGAVAPADASAKEVKKEGAPELDRGAYQRSLSKREKKAVSIGHSECVAFVCPHTSAQWDL